jgi:murein DD-endopeptidase MepM/ murein hydrolase activator NlpD
MGEPAFSCPGPRMGFPLPGPRVQDQITSGYGPRGATRPDGTRDFHLGVDFHAPIGTPVLAVASGQVNSITTTQRGGLTLEICHPDGVCSQYQHLSQIVPRLAPGQQVTAGQAVAFTGNSGSNTTGAHLHLGTRITPQNTCYQDANPHDRHPRTGEIFVDPAIYLPRYN